MTVTKDLSTEGVVDQQLHSADPSVGAQDPNRSSWRISRFEELQGNSKTSHGFRPISFLAFRTSKGWVFAVASILQVVWCTLDTFFSRRSILSQRRQFSNSTERAGVRVANFWSAPQGHPKTWGACSCSRVHGRERGLLSYEAGPL